MLKLLYKILLLAMKFVYGVLNIILVQKRQSTEKDMETAAPAVERINEVIATLHNGLLTQNKCYLSFFFIYVSKRIWEFCDEPSFLFTGS